MLTRSLISTMLTLMLGAASAMARNANEPEVDSTSTIAVGHSISRNIFIEYGGPSYGVGVGYDQRFKPTSVFGFRAGLSYTSGSFDDSGWWGAHRTPYTEVDFKGVAIPLEINAILGKRASKFELGVGVTPCILHRHEVKRFDLELYPDWPTYVKDGVRINAFGTLNIGYRLQRKSGFFMRTGLTLVMGDIEYSPMEASFPTFNISLGYTLK